MSTTARPTVLPRAVLATALSSVVFAVGPGALEANAQDPLPAHTPDATIARADVPDGYKWDLSPLFASDEAWEQARAKLLAEIPSLEAHRGKLADPKQLEGCLATYFRLHRDADFVALYANLRNATSLSDPKTTTMFQRGLQAMDELTRVAAFIRSEVLSFTPQALEAAFAQEAGLGEYRAYLDNLSRRSSRVLSPDAEEALGLLGDNLWVEIELSEVPSSVEDVYSALFTDIRWPTIEDEQDQPVQLTLPNYSRFRASPSRKVRKAAVGSLLGTLRKYENTLAASLAGQFKLDIAFARARKYDTALEAYLDKEGIEVAVFDNLVRTVNAQLPLLHRYVELRKKVMGLGDVHLYDLYVPLTPSVDTTIPFPQAREKILETLRPLGPDYGKLLAEGLEPSNGWIDLYLHADKRSGAFSLATYGPPPYVLMNYQDSLGDMSTLAHELGHALHSHLAARG